MFTGGTVVTSRGRRPAHLYVSGGRVEAITSEALPADLVIDVRGAYVLPGMVDSHVHLMDPGASDREDFPSGTSAAAANGVTTILEHTHSHPVRSPLSLSEKLRHLAGRSHVDYGLAAHVWPEDIPGLRDLWRAGVTFFKVFTCTTHGVPGLSVAELKDCFDSVAAFGGTCLVHCEDEALTAAAQRSLLQAGRSDPGVILEWRSREAELIAVQVVALLARLADASVTIAHVSHPAVASIVRRERAAGGDIAAEVCPQYLVLREDEILDHGAFRKFTPPARSRTDADEQEMWQLLRSGVLSHLSTDHAPATEAQKSESTIWDAHFGLPGLDTTLPLMLDAVVRSQLSLEDLVRVYSEAPARRYGLYPRKGSLTPGSDADVVVVDLGSERTLRNSDVLSRAGWTPYAGRTVRGRVISTWLRGQQIGANGRCSGLLLGDFLPGPGAVSRRKSSGDWGVHSRSRRHPAST